MNRLKAIVALLLAAVWLPASSHALLQHFGLIHQAHTHHHAEADHSHEHDGDYHEAADGRCLLSSGKIQISKPVIVSVPHWLVVDLVATRSVLESAITDAGPSPPGVAPPELSHHWQFSFRAALPVRAPSFAS